MSWTCDVCNQPIHNVQDGWVEWLTRMGPNGTSNYSHSLRLVHHMPSSPQPGGCQYNGNQVYAANKDLVSDLGLDFFSSDDGLVNLLQKLSDQEFQDPEEVIEMIKRLHLSNYEAARPYLQQAIAQGVIELNSKPGYQFQDQLLAIRHWAGV